MCQIETYHWIEINGWHLAWYRLKPWLNFFLFLGQSIQMGDSNPNRYSFQQRTGNQQQNDQAAFYQQQYMAQDNNRPLFSQQQQSNQQMMGNGTRTTPLPNAQMLYYQLQQQQQNPMQFQQFQQQQRMMGQRPDLGQSNAPTVSLNATNAQGTLVLI